MKPFELDAAAIQRVDRAATGGYLDERAVSAMRCVLALSAPLVMLIDGAPPTRLTVLAFGSLLGYCAYCVFLFIAALRGKAFIASRAQHWVDILAYAWLAALSSGTNSIFFYFFFFPVVVASFSRGLREGVAATLASVLLFALIGFATSPEILQSDLQEALARPLYLLLLGCMLAYWGGHEKALRRRIRMLEEVGTVANPRLGVEHAMTQNLRRLLAIFHADACVVVCAKPGSADYLMYRVAASPENAAVAPRVLTAQSAQALLELPPAVSVVWNPGRPQHDGSTADACRRLANLLETSFFVTVPYRQREGASGRVYLTAGRRCFKQADVELLRLAAGRIAAALDHLMLVEELMANAAQLERSRISRDIHDTAVQPYIGLKLGLEALYRKLDPDSHLALQLKELLVMSGFAVEDLRGYVARLRARGHGLAGEQLASALRDHAGRYRRFYGIEVELRGDRDVQLTDRIAAEAYQIVCEALSNVHRHTHAKRAFVELRGQPDSLAIEVGNERSPPTKTAFTPRSIAERAATLGGEAVVRLDNNGHDVVRVTIPL